MANTTASNTAVNRIQNFITGTDQSKAAFESVGASLRKVAGGVTNLRGRLRDLTVVGAGVTAIFRSLANAASTASKAVVDIELAERRLEFTLKKTGQFTAETKRGFLDLAEVLQFTTRFTAGTVIEMEQLLLSMGKLSAEQVPETIETLLSYIDVYKGGQGAIEITRQFARATGGLGGDVGEMGIFMDQTLSTTERWAQAMDQLKAKFEGAAFFLANTASGRLTTFQNVLTQVTLNLGQAALRSGSFQNALEAVIVVVQRMRLASVGVDEVSEAMTTLADKILGTVIGGLLAFAEIMTVVIPTAITIVVSIVEILTGSLFLLGKGLSEIFEKGGGFGDQLVFWGVISEDTALAISNLGDKIASLGEVLGGAAVTGFGEDQEQVNKQLDKSRQFTDAIATSMQTVAEIIRQVATEFQRLQDEQEGSTKKFKEMDIAANDLSNAFTEQTRSLVESKAAIQNYQAATTKFFVEAFDRSIGLTEAYENLGDALRDAFVADAAELSTSALFSRSVEVKGPEGQFVKFEEQLGPLGAAIELATTPFKAIGDTIGDAITQTTLLGDTTQTVAGAMKSAFDPLAQVLGQMFALPIQLLGTLFDATIGFLIKMLGQALASIFGISTASVAAKTTETVAALAQMGIITAAASAAAGALTIAWAPAATLAAIATLGGALAAGAAVPGVVTANIAAITAITAGSGVLGTAVGGVPGLQEGALVTGPTLAALAERGRPELILPLDSPAVRDLFKPPEPPTIINQFEVPEDLTRSLAGVTALGSQLRTLGSIPAQQASQLQSLIPVLDVPSGGLQEGGLAVRPTIAALAEKGTPELILPLDSPAVTNLFEGARSTSSTNTINLNIASVAVNDRRDIDVLVDEISRRLGEQLDDTTGFGRRGGVGRGT